MQVIITLRRDGVGHRNQESRGRASSDHNTHEERDRNCRSDDDDEHGNGDNNDDGAVDAEVHGKGGGGVEGVPRAILDVEALFGAQQAERPVAGVRSGGAAVVGVEQGQRQESSSELDGGDHGD